MLIEVSTDKLLLLDIIDYLFMYQQQLKIDCLTNKLFSFCQEAYVIVIDFSTSTIHSFKRENCNLSISLSIRLG